MPNVKAWALAVKVNPPRTALAEIWMSGSPVEPKKAVPIGTAVPGNQLPATLKSLVMPFQVAFWARATVANATPTSINTAQIPEVRFMLPPGTR